MNDDYDFLKCDECKNKLKEAVILRDGQRVCKIHIEPGNNDYIPDIKLNNYLNALESIENTLNMIQKLSHKYTKAIEDLKKIENSFINKQSIYKKIFPFNLCQELKKLNEQNSKLNDIINNLIDANQVDFKEVDKRLSDFRCQLNLVSVINKINQLSIEVTELYDEIHAKVNNINFIEPKMDITLQNMDMRKEDPLIITCCCLDRLKPVIYLGSEAGHIIIYDFLNNKIDTKEEHEKKINSIDVNHENTLLASCSSDKLIKIWLLENFTVIKTLNKHKNSVNFIKFSPYINPNRRYLRWFASAEEKFLRLWNYDTTSFEINHVKDFCEESNVHAEILHISFSSGGAILAGIVNDYSIIIYSLITENKEAELEFIKRDNNSSRTSKNVKNIEGKAMFKLEFENLPNEIRFLKEFDNSSLRIVKYRLDEWYSYELNNSEESNGNKIITFKWNCNDTLIFVGIAAGDFSSIKIFDAETRSKLEECPQLTDSGLNKLTIIEPHPTKPNIFATLNETGSFIIWDICSNDHIRYKNETAINITHIRWSLQHSFILLISNTSLVHVFKIENEETFDLKNTENSLISIGSANERNYIMREFYNAASIKKSEKMKTLKSNSNDTNKELGKKRRSTSKRQDTTENVQGETILMNFYKKIAEYDTSEDEEIE